MENLNLNRVSFFREMKHLKSEGARINAKVTLKQIGHITVIYIGDFEFYSFTSALNHLKHIASTLAMPVMDVLEENEIEGGN